MKWNSFVFICCCNLIGDVSYFFYFCFLTDCTASRRTPIGKRRSNFRFEFHHWNFRYYCQNKTKQKKLSRCFSVVGLTVLMKQQKKKTQKKIVNEMRKLRKMEPMDKNPHHWDSIASPILVQMN